MRFYKLGQVEINGARYGVVVMSIEVVWLVLCNA